MWLQVVYLSNYLSIFSGCSLALQYFVKDCTQVHVHGHLGHPKNEVPKWVKSMTFQSVVAIVKYLVLPGGWQETLNWVNLLNQGKLQIFICWFSHLPEGLLFSQWVKFKLKHGFVMVDGWVKNTHFQWKLNSIGEQYWYPLEISTVQ